MKIEYKMPDHCVDHGWNDTFCGISDIEINKKTAQRWFAGCFTSEPPAQVRVVDGLGNVVYHLIRKDDLDEKAKAK